ncbi:MAG: DUF2933 domain-containing protein [Candidatus Rokubacteria bacterium]|nr:DUF2933 domain-containing protein [Candidatus Rokubacteria bacterium]
MTNGQRPPDTGPWFRTRSGFALIGFLLIAGFFLVTEHTAHLLGILPYLLLLACPLLHFFLARREEREVQAECGEAYARYARRVPGFIPRFRGRIERRV